MHKKYEYPTESLKFRTEYYKNPLTISDIGKQAYYSNKGILFLGEYGVDNIPDYLVDYNENYIYYDSYFYKKYSRVILNWLYAIDSADNTPLSTTQLSGFVPKYISWETEINFPKLANNNIFLVLYNNYKYSKIYSTIVLKYGILDNLDITREEIVTEVYGNQKNELTEVHGKQLESTSNSIGDSKVTSDYGKQTSTGTTQPVTTTTVNPATKSTTLNKSTTYDSETAYLHDSSETTTDTNTVQVSTGIQADEAKTDAYTDTVTNSARNDLSNVSRETYTDTTTDEKDGYTNTVTRKSREYGDASVRTVADNIKQEREIAYINLLDIIFKDVLNGICDYVIY